MSDEELVPNPYAALEDKADPNIPTATLQIYNYIDKYLGERRDNNVNRCSAATMCVKRRQYQRQGAPQEQLTPRKLVNFLLGDLTERTLVHFIKEACVGPGKLYSDVDFGTETGEIHFQNKPLKIYAQKTLSFKLDDLTITGHADGFGKRNSDGRWELIECKSAANWGFKSFQTDGVDDYIKQSHALFLTNECRALDIKDVRFFYLRKETGHVWDRVFYYSEEIARKVVKEFRLSNRDEPIAPPFPLVDEVERKKPTGRKIAEFPCTYCPYLKQCHGNFEVQWKADQWFNKKPKYVFSEVTNEV